MFYLWDSLLHRLSKRAKLDHAFQCGMYGVATAALQVVLFCILRMFSGSELAEAVSKVAHKDHQLEL